MTAYVSNTTAAEIGERIFNARNCAILTHAKPDGDALGSTLALSRAISARGGAASIYLCGPLEAGLRACAGETPIQVDVIPPDDVHDCVVIVDTGSWSQLDAMADWVRARKDQTVVIDHHRHGDDVGDVLFVCPESASATMVLLDIFDATDDSVVAGGRDSVAEALFLGLGTDTGWFRHSNADAAAFAMASRLLALGVEKDRLYQLTDQSYPPRRLAIEARALSSLRYVAGNRAAVMSLSATDFEETGTQHEELTGIVNMPLCVSTVRVSVLLTEVDAGRTKVSFRSKSAGPDGGSDVVDVNLLAQRFGGGGHMHAAGAKIDGTLAEAIDQIVAAVESVG